jgi:hypothetical protein
MTARKWFPDRIAELKTLAENGYSAAQAAEIFGVSRDAIYLAANRHGISFHSLPIRFILDHQDNRFVQARVAKNLTLLDVEVDTGLAPSTIRRYERGVKRMRKDIVQILAEEYGVTVEWLLGEVGA